MAILKDLIVNGAARILGDTHAGKVTGTSFVKNGGTASQFLMADGTTKTLSTSVLQNNTNPVTSGAVWTFCDEFEEVTATALNYLNLSKQDKLTAGSGIALTQASGSAIISVAGVPREVLSATHAGLVQLRNNNRLAPGQWYRITDYNPTFITTYEGLTNYVMSGHHRFDILVMATSYNALAPDAYACRHEGDNYFTNCVLEEWTLKYALTDPYEDAGFNFKKYDWCDAATDGGIIYEMIDENGNECPYDFKNVMIKVIGAVNAGYDRTRYTVEDYGERYGYAAPYYYTFTLFDDELEASTDFSVEIMNSSRSLDYEGENQFDQLRNNVIKPYRMNISRGSGRFSSMTQHHLNSIVLDYRWDISGDDTAEICDNYFDYDCRRIFMLSGHFWTTSFCNNYFETYCYGIFCGQTDEGGFDNCTVGRNTNNCILNGCTKVHVGIGCYGVLVSGLEVSSIGDGCHEITISGWQTLTEDIYVSRNSIGRGCNHIYISRDSTDNVIENRCQYIYLTSFACHNHIGSECQNIGLYGGGYNTFEHACQHIGSSNSNRTYITSNRPDLLAVIPMWNCTFKPYSCCINLQCTGNIRRMHIFSSASGTSISNIQNIACTSKPGDASGNISIDECVARTSATGAPVIKSPVY